MMLGETIITTTESNESTDTELLEQILVELQKMNEEPVEDSTEEPGTETEEIFTEFQQLVIENQQIENSVSIGVFGMLLFLVGVLLARITFRKM